MKLSSKGRYGVRALFDLAFHAADGPAQIKDIAARQAIPARFLEQIFQDLRRAGLITSKRGPHGGYRLARAASAIRVGDILRAIDGPIGDLVGDDRASGGQSKRTPSLRAANRATDEVFRELSIEIEACFDRVTIADIVRKAEALAGAQRDASRIVYAI